MIRFHSTTITDEAKTWDASYADLDSITIAVFGVNEVSNDIPEHEKHLLILVAFGSLQNLLSNFETQLLLSPTHCTKRSRKFILAFVTDVTVSRLGIMLCGCLL